MKIAHEAPLSIFEEVSSLTDYDYALVHLFEESDEYFNKFKEKIAQGREVILDNSIFEIGEAFESSRYSHWIQELSPTWYIIPDALEDKNQTLSNMEDWFTNYDHLVPGKSIGVVQGKNYTEVVECYQSMKDRVDKIAISFDYSFFTEWFPNEANKYHSYMKGRQALIRMMLEDKVIDITKPHHLLGCGLPQEFQVYRDMEWIDSLDTSNPVVHGILGMKYTENGLEDKSSVKLFTLIDDEVVDHLSDIRYNIAKFRELTKGEEVTIA